MHWRPVVRRDTFFVLPERLEARGDVRPSVLHRGLYDVRVYTAGLDLDATFSRPVLPADPGHRVEILWDEAQVVVALSDLSAVSAVGRMAWQGRPMHVASGAVPGLPALSGVRAAVGGFDGDEARVSVQLELRGTESLMVGAVAETSEVVLTGSWDAPSFTGFTLPRERVVDGGSFSGTWSVPGVARPVAQVVRVGADPTPANQVLAHTVGVRLVEPASAYASVERAITYGLLVIGLGLLAFLVVEWGLGLRLHPVQWLVNGMALVVFYLVLLAVSEHLGFPAAYGAAAGLTVALVSGYTLLASGSARAGGAVLAALGVLYAAMYGMLRSEDHALLAGTGLVVVALACVMWVTRHLGGERPPAPAAAGAG